MRLTRGNESIRCETVCSKIVYSVRIGPPQPSFFSLNHFRTSCNHPNLYATVEIRESSPKDSNLPFAHAAQNEKIAFFGEREASQSASAIRLAEWANK